MSGPGVTVPHGALLTGCVCCPLPHPHSFLALGEVGLLETGLFIFGDHSPGVQPSGPGGGPHLAWRERKQKQKKAKEG